MLRLSLLFSSLAFDLTVTSIYVPQDLRRGNHVIYDDGEDAKRLLVLRVFEDDAVDVVKLTPAHLALVRERDSRHAASSASSSVAKISKQNWRTVFMSNSAEMSCNLQRVRPTETVVGAMCHHFDPSPI